MVAFEETWCPARVDGSAAESRHEQRERRLREVVPMRGGVQGSASSQTFAKLPDVGHVNVQEPAWLQQGHQLSPDLDRLLQVLEDLARDDDIEGVGTAEQELVERPRYQRCEAPVGVGGVDKSLVQIEADGIPPQPPRLVHENAFAAAEIQQARPGSLGLEQIEDKSRRPTLPLEERRHQMTRQDPPVGDLLDIVRWLRVGEDHPAASTAGYPALPGAIMRRRPGIEAVIPTAAEGAGDFAEGERCEAHTGRLDRATGVAWGPAGKSWRNTRSNCAIAESGVW